MNNSPSYRDDAPSSLPSPTSACSSTSPTRTITTISGSTIFVETDPSSFKQVVQMLTGCHSPTHQPEPRYSLPPVIPAPYKKHSSSSSSGVRIYERRNSKNPLVISPVFNPVHSGLPGKVPSSLILSPDTPLLPDPFYRPGSIHQSPTASAFRPYDPARSSDVEQREIREKGFYLHPSPSSTRTNPEPRLLTLFPLTSPRASESLPASP